MPVRSKLLRTLDSYSFHRVDTDPWPFPRVPPNLPTYYLPSRRDCSDLFPNSPSTPSIEFLSCKPIHQYHRCSLAASTFEPCTISLSICSHQVHVPCSENIPTNPHVSHHEHPHNYFTLTLSLSIYSALYDCNATLIMIQ